MTTIDNKSTVIPLCDNPTDLVGIETEPSRTVTVRIATLNAADPSAATRPIAPV